MSGELYTMKSILRYGRDGALWRASNFRFITGFFHNRRNNEKHGFTDDDHLLAAVEWLVSAQDASKDGGISGRYNLRTGWTSSYPETTGYIVPTFLRLEKTLNRPIFRERAQRCIDFLLSVQLDNGAFPGMEIAENQTEPSVFNSAQIICGLKAWHEATGDKNAIHSAKRAADWLVAEQDNDGAWRKYSYNNITYTYMSHAACWLAELGAYLNDQTYLEAAGSHLEWVLTHYNHDTGWFEKCGFETKDHDARRAVTHTIAYTLWGVLMISKILDHKAGMQAVYKAALSIARRLELSRILPGELDFQWRSKSHYMCLTGNAQMALIWFELHRLYNDATLVSAAFKAIDLIKRAQNMFSSDRGIRGGIPGSDPIWGNYIYMTIPNWAAKFFIDAMLEKKEILANLKIPPSDPPALSSDIPTTLPDITNINDHVRYPRIVLYTSYNSQKAVELLNAWSVWGFRPEAIVVSHTPAPQFVDRLLSRVHDEGIGVLIRKFVGLKGLLSTSVSAGQSSKFKANESISSYCQRMGLKVVETGPLNSEETLETIRLLRPDLAIQAGAGILRKGILSIPRLGTLNAHMGILPPYRGIHVAEWSRIMGGTVGCTVHLIDEGIDTGDIICCRAITVNTAKSIAELRNCVDKVQIELLGDVVRYIIASGKLPPKRNQKFSEGRQYFAMHPDLKTVLENTLHSPVAK